MGIWGIILLPPLMDFASYAPAYIYMVCAIKPGGGSYGCKGGLQSKMLRVRACTGAFCPSLFPLSPFFSPPFLFYACSVTSMLKHIIFVC